MNGKEHFKVWNLFYIIFSFVYLFRNSFSWFNLNILFCGYFMFFWINPDDDQIIVGTKAHRWFITHSAIYPILFYLILRVFLNIELAKIFGVFLFLPVILHLIFDYRIDHLIGNVSTLWKISFYPFKIRLDKKGSFIWILINELIMIVYIIMFV